MQSLTVIETHPSRLQTKNLITGESYAKTSRLLSAERVEFKSLKALKKVLKRLADEPNKCVIRGELRPDVEPPLRRRLSYFNDTPQAWVMLDIDKFKLPKSLRYTPYDEHTMQAIRQKLPAAFQEVSFVWQASASAGVDPKLAKLHLWFLLDAPLTAAQLRMWLRDASDIIDPVTLRAVQPHYTADPIGGIKHYDGPRLGIYRGHSMRVTTPEDIAAYQEPESVAPELAKRPKGAADVADAQIRGAMKAAVTRSHELLRACRVAYLDAYKVGALLGPAVALATWNDKKRGHETWTELCDKLAARWGKRFAKLPETNWEPDTYVARVAEGIAWGVANERARLAERSDRAVSEALERTAALQERMLTRLAKHAGSEKVLQEVGAELGRYAHVIGREQLIESLRMHSGLSESQCEASIVDAVPVDVSAWREGLLFKGELIEATDSNIASIFERYPGFDRSFEFNTRTQEMIATSTNVLGIREGIVNIDSLPRLLVQWLAGVGVRRVSMAQAFNVFRAHQAELVPHFDPMLRAFPEALLPPEAAAAQLAKMKPRLDRWLYRYLNATGDDAYVRAVAAKTLIGAIARAAQPGAEVHTMPVLMGGQGIGKTRTIKTLASVIDRGYRELLDMRDKDCLLAMQSATLVEVSELKALRTSQEEHIKAFFSRNVDNVRAPYARQSQDLPRRMVFIGTTNDDTFLSDHENRRYWPVWCDGGDRIMSTEDAVLLWREAALRYAAGESWWLDTPDTSDAQKAATALAREENMLEHILRKQLRKVSEVTFLDAARMVYPDPVQAYRNSRAVTKALVSLGFKRKRTGKKRLWRR